ncbi:hypothetical protein N658DRAFT_523120 [Parathielavia hyrcaniae]|uniref:Uncharacterized protein n=1 Tax=Parathielavia hyrcaniae TaxID=113614 RepID=A0AAN6T367_9PEZI|nr:hypothetical protein N658DRAFT_523120 [Parathielavia hyrcaniae]
MCNPNQTGGEPAQSKAVKVTSSTDTDTAYKSANLNRYLGQDMFEDANLHGRTLDRATLKAYVPFYEAKASNAIVDFNTAFHGASGSASRK